MTKKIQAPKAFKLETAFNGVKFQPYLYAAYGMNTAMAGMRGRCPFAEPAGTVILRNHKLVFRGVADVTWSLGRQVHLALWRFTADCEQSLDRLEGYQPKGASLYDKRWFKISGAGPLANRWAMLYVMSSRDYVAPPSPGYEGMLRQGYGEFGMPIAQIDTAIDEARRGWRMTQDRLLSGLGVSSPSRQHDYRNSIDPRGDEGDEETV